MPYLAVLLYFLLAIVTALDSVNLFLTYKEQKKKKSYFTLFMAITGPIFAIGWAYTGVVMFLQL